MCGCQNLIYLQVINHLIMSALIIWKIAAVSTEECEVADVYDRLFFYLQTIIKYLKISISFRCNISPQIILKSVVFHLNSLLPHIISKNSQKHK